MAVRVSATPAEGTALRDRIIDAASKVFIEEGYESFSMRRVAQEVGCSQMAMYRHFANKEALTQHLCSELYSRFATKMNREIEAASDPREQLHRFIAALIRFATSYPDHYSLIFLERHTNPEENSEREQLGKEFIQKIHGIVRSLLDADTPDSVVQTKLRQLLTCLHGTAALLIAHPKAYGLTRQKALDDVEATFRGLLGY
ncbi:TetR/AcrR family transcriptional regulator [Granulicella sp. WH15]|uniref:TetR/AcrR family transcriptional regulator n=1 Tax=Granulicella sp. WH15 TaxID=2602070 RepID=UPI0013A5A8E9|nr:TetR/AcrR family transcriptional regulator [Granulicella sp. WH15]